MSAVLVAGVLFAWPSEWLGSRELHTLMELLAMLLAFFVSALALARYYSRKSKAFLYIATAFVGTGLLDGYHAAVTSSFVSPLLPSGLGSLIPWSWLASRSFLALFLVFALRAEPRASEGVDQRDERRVYAAAALLTLLSFLFFAFAPLPRAYYLEWFFHRPQEFVPALAFGIALIGFYKLRRWEEEVFHQWLVLSLLAGVASQVLYMPLATTNFDIWFDLAHMLKVASYALVLAGLLENTRGAFREAEASVIRLSALNKEVAEAGKQFESLIEAAPYGILVTDSGGQITLVNDRAEKMFGYERADLVDKPIEDLVPAASSSSSQDVQGRRADGSVFWADVTLVPVRSGARPHPGHSCRHDKKAADRGGAGKTHTRPRSLEQRPGRIRLRGVARPTRAPAGCLELHTAARGRLRRPVGRQRQGVHPVRRRRGAAHEGHAQRPSGLLSSRLRHRIRIHRLEQAHGRRERRLRARTR